MGTFTVHSGNVSAFRTHVFSKLQLIIVEFGHDLKSYIQELISIPVIPNGRSAPFNPPHLETGELLASIFVSERSGGVDVGSTAEYAMDLERGTARFEPRPFLENSLYLMISMLQRSLR